MAVVLFLVTSLITVTPCAFLAHFLQVYQRRGQDFPRSLAPALRCCDSSGLCAFALTEQKAIQPAVPGKEGEA